MFLTMDEIIVTSINQSLNNLISKRILNEIAKFKWNFEIQTDAEYILTDLKQIYKVRINRIFTRNLGYLAVK